MPLSVVTNFEALLDNRCTGRGIVRCNRPRTREDVITQTLGFSHFGLLESTFDINIPPKVGPLRTPLIQHSGTLTDVTLQLSFLYTPAGIIENTPLPSAVDLKPSADFMLAGFRTEITLPTETNITGQGTTYGGPGGTFNQTFDLGPKLSF